MPPKTHLNLSVASEEEEEEDDSVLVPAAVPSLPLEAGASVRQVDAGAEHAVLLNDKGKVYTRGANDFK